MKGSNNKVTLIYQSSDILSKKGKEYKSRFYSGK